MGASPEQYAGREQAYVKHFLLRNYFSDLIHKIASAYDEIVYVDGYSGPWQSVDVSLVDTSFVIALEVMRSAKEAWKKAGAATCACMRCWSRRGLLRLQSWKRFQPNFRTSISSHFVASLYR